MTRRPLRALLLAALAAVSCATSGPRRPDRQVEIVPDFQTRRVVDVAVLPVRAEGTSLSVPLLADFRAEIVAFLKDRKSYSVPETRWVDDQLGAWPGGFAGGVEAASAKFTEGEAILEARVTDWSDGRLMAGRRMHASGEFSLHASGSGERLWRFTFTDEPLVVEERAATSDWRGMQRLAIRALVGRALDTLPDKPAPAPAGS